MKKLLLLLACLISLSLAYAQIGFTASFSYSGSCSGDIGSAVWYGFAESLCNHYNSMTFASCEECNALRGGLLSNSGTMYGCTIHFSATPCAPCGGDILGPSQGSSFLSSNPANEVRDWSSDDIERHLALDNNYQPKRPDAIVTKDNEFNEQRAKARANSAWYFDSNKPFTPVNPREEGLNAMKPDDLSIQGKSNEQRTKAEENSGWYVDPDKPFIPVNMREGGSSVTKSADFSLKRNFDEASDVSFLANSENVQRYINKSTLSAESYLAYPQDLTQLLHNQFKFVSGFDLETIMLKLPQERTDAEKQALIDYQEYRKAVLGQMINDIDRIIDNSKEKKEMDAAILAMDVYGTDEEGYIKQTNYIKQDLESLINSSPNNPIADVAFAIKACNDTQNETGFHAELYYNRGTNTYVISCAGTDDLVKDGIINDGSIALNLLGGDIDIVQYQLAKTIGDAINRIPRNQRDQLNIEVVGHSLGGGIASIIGLTSGIETKTYNSATVPDNFLKENGLFEKVKNNEVQNIIAYHTSTDILTNLQNAKNKPAIGISTDIGDPATLMEKAKAAGTGAAIGTLTPAGALGGAAIGKMIEGHFIQPLVRSICDNNNKKKETEWDRFRYIQSSIRNNASCPERQTQDSILIRLND